MSPVKCNTLKTMLDNRRNAEIREITILPLKQCSGGCTFCFLNKENIGDQDWDALFKSVFEYFSLVDIPVDKIVNVKIYGGELFMTKLITKEYTDNLKKLLQMVTRFMEGRRYSIDFPISLENIEEPGILLARELKRLYPNVRLLTSYNSDRLKDKEKQAKFWENLKMIGGVYSIGVMFTGERIGRDVKKSLMNYGLLDLEEPLMVEGFSYSYKDIGEIERPSANITCSANTLRYITSKGVFTCAGITRKPWWISGDQWAKLNDETFLDEGYEEVIEWYGCDICEKEASCPGMCWITYYAQRYLYNNKKCLYKKVEE